MSLNEKLGRDYITAMKAKDAVALSVLRLLKTAISNRLVELKQPGGTLTDEEIMGLLLKQAKQRKDSIEQFEKAGRNDLAEKEQRELKVLESYLPSRLDDSQLAAVVEQEIRSIGATSPQDAGRVIGAIMAKYKGQADGKKVSVMVNECLAHR